MIDKVTNGVREIFNELKLNFEGDYTASLITNGSLLSAAVLEKLKEWKIRMVQVTIDGSKEVHNLRRPFKGGNPSFDIVFENFMNLI